MVRQDKRKSRRTADRVGRGMLGADRRTRRRENKRQTELDLDPEALETDKDGRVTLSLSLPLAKKLTELLRGAGLKIGKGGDLEVALGPSLGLDTQGRVASVVGDSIARLVDSTGGTVDPGGDVSGVTASDMATVLDKVNRLLDALSAGQVGA